MAETKRCFKCGKVKPLDEFYAHPRMADGHLNKCKECTRRDRRDHEKNHPDAILESRIRQCKKNPTHNNAYKVVEAAVAAGVLTKPNVCSACGCPDTERRMEAHHYDYAKPLDVIWLCTVCHDRADQMRREQCGLPRTSASRPVVMMKDGRVICRFSSISDAIKSAGVGRTALSRCLKGDLKTAAGFEWSYDDSE